MWRCTLYEKQTSFSQDYTNRAHELDIMLPLPRREVVEPREAVGPRGVVELREVVEACAVVEPREVEDP